MNMEYNKGVGDNFKNMKLKGGRDISIRICMRVKGKAVIENKKLTSTKC